MNFVSITFLAFVAVVYAVYWRLESNDRRKIWLIAASYVFYAIWDWRFCGLMLLVTANAWLTGRELTQRPVESRGKLLAASIALDLVVLGFFKYFNFFLSSATDGLRALGIGVGDVTLSIVLPIGISFYTFHAISYVFDVRRGKIPAAPTFRDVALYIAFFPQLIAGPITRASFFLPQLARARRFFGAQQEQGVRLFIRGFIYKAVLADTLAQTADPVFDHASAYNAAALVTATIAFYGQIYFDFAGYSCMAIGTARLFGYRLPRNFDFPYLSASLTDFWRRWHMSLSFWIRDYVYISLGGSRGPTGAFYRNLMIAMLLGGLWHGAAWTFVIWGGLHGLGLCLHKVWLTCRSRLGLPWLWSSPAWMLFAIALTQIWVIAAWIFFRCAHLSDVSLFLRAWVGSAVPGNQPVSQIAPVVLLVLLVDHLLGTLRGVPRLRFAPARPIVWFGMGALVAIALTLMPVDQRPFIYFQF